MWNGAQMVVVPAVDEIQVTPETRPHWVLHTALDAHHTWRLYTAVRVRALLPRTRQRAANCDLALRRQMQSTDRRFDASAAACIIHGHFMGAMCYYGVKLRRSCIE